MNAKDLNILLIEDNPSDMHLIREMLAEAGPARFVVTCADRLSTGLEQLAQGDMEAVLLDLDLPDSQGLDTLRRVVSELPTVPAIVALTDLDDEDMGTQAIEAGAEDCLVKGQVDANLLSRALRYAIERKWTRDALQQSEERYRSTLDNMMEGCQIIGSDWRYLYINDACVGHGRQTKENLLGRTMMEVYPGIEKTEMFGFLRRCMEEHKPHHMENRFTYPDGSESWFELSIQPVPEGVFILSIDVTERKRAEEALREHREHLEDLVAERTADLRKMVNAMAGREVRMAELKGVIRKLQAQLEEAGLEPVADDPLLARRARRSAFHSRRFEWRADYGSNYTRRGK